METRIPGLMDVSRVGGAQRAQTPESHPLQKGGLEVSRSVRADPHGAAATVNQHSESRETDLQAAVVEMNEFVQSVNRDIDFKLDDDSGQVVVRITDRKTGDMIRQIPSEEALRLAESLSEARSLLGKTKA